MSTQPSQCTLTVEDEEPIVSPQPEDIASAVMRMTENGGPGFAIADGMGDDYAQVAGGDGVFIGEWREYDGDSFRHWKAIIPDRPFGDNRATPNTEGGMQIPPNERLTAEDAIGILQAYVSKGKKPTHVDWQDMTAQFL